MGQPRWANLAAWGVPHHVVEQHPGPTAPCGAGGLVDGNDGAAVALEHLTPDLIKTPLPDLSATQQLREEGRGGRKWGVGQPGSAPQTAAVAPPPAPHPAPAQANSLSQPGTPWQCTHRSDKCHPYFPRLVFGTEPGKTSPAFVRDVIISCATCDSHAGCCCLARALVMQHHPGPWRSC